MRLLLVIVWLVMAQWMALAAPKWPIKVSSANPRLLVDQDNTPFLIKGASCWGGWLTVGLADWTNYLNAKATQNVNTLLFQIIDNSYQTVSSNQSVIPPANFYGEVPFSDTNNWYTINTNTYWTRAHDYMAAAKSKGFTLMTFGAYLGNSSGSLTNGWRNPIRVQWDNAGGAGGNTNSLAYYGAFLGSYFSDLSNIIWVAFGDQYPSQLDAKDTNGNNLIYMALTNVTPAVVVTGHDLINNGVSRYNRAINLNSVYIPAYTHDTAWSKGNTEYDRSLVKPWFFVEGWYENEGGASEGALPRLARNQTLWTMTSGGVGSFIGENKTWTFTNGWLTWATSPIQMDHDYIWDLFDTITWWTGVPDRSYTFMTNNGGTRTHITASVCSNSTYALAYFPTCAIGNQFTLSRFTNANTHVQVDWFNPDNGTTTEVGRYLATGTLNVTRDFATYGTNDALLMFTATNGGSLGKGVMTGRTAVSGKVKLK